MAQKRPAIQKITEATLLAKFLCEKNVMKSTLQRREKLKNFFRKLNFAMISKRNVTFKGSWFTFIVDDITQPLLFLKNIASKYRPLELASVFLLSIKMQLKQGYI